MDNFDLRKFLAESRKPIQETVETVEEAFGDSRRFADKEEMFQIHTTDSPDGKGKWSPWAGRIFPNARSADEWMKKMLDGGYTWGLKKVRIDSDQVKETSIEENDVASTILSNANSSFDGAFNDAKGSVSEYVQEALKGENADAVYEIIEARCNRAAMEMKMEVVAEILEAYDGRINELEENAVFKEMLDETKMANIKEIRQGLYEMAAELKETYKETYMPEEKVEEKKAPKKEKKEDKEEKEEK